MIIENLLENQTLKVLDLNSNEISFKGCEALARYIRLPSCTLEALHIASNKCSDFGAKALSQAIAVNQSLLHIDMTYNSVNN